MTTGAFRHKAKVRRLFQCLWLYSGQAERGAKQCANFRTKPLMRFCMVGKGIAFTDLGGLAAALTWQSAVIGIAVVPGAAIGSGLMGTLLGFNPVEPGITAGLRMAARRGGLARCSPAGPTPA